MVVVGRRSPFALCHCHPLAAGLCWLMWFVRRLTARQISDKEQNSSVRRQHVHCPLDMVRRLTARQISEKEQNSSVRRQPVRSIFRREEKIGNRKIDSSIWREEIGNRNRLVNLAGRNRQLKLHTTLSQNILAYCVSFMTMLLARA
jgi:hypothetical protein